MLFAHTFAHPETLSRAHSWLTQVGFHPRRIEGDIPGSSRLVLVDEPHRLAAAKMLINAAEHADPDGFPSLWDNVLQPRGAVNVYHEAGPSEPRKPHSSVIGWHPLD